MEVLPAQKMSITINTTSVQNLTVITERYLKNRDVQSPGDAVWITYCIENEYGNDHELSLQLMGHVFRSLDKTTKVIRESAENITHKSKTPLWQFYATVNRTIRSDCLKEDIAELRKANRGSGRERERRRLSFTTPKQSATPDESGTPQQRGNEEKEREREFEESEVYSDLERRESDRRIKEMQKELALYTADRQNERFSAKEEAQAKLDASAEEREKDSSTQKWEENLKKILQSLLQTTEQGALVAVEV